MFKEQLHESFDAISPSPELLDRISAMMSEEVSHPKPSIKMNAVRYGGIAAALAIAAGGTFIVMQNANGGIGTTKSSEAAVAETAPAAKAAFDDAAEAAPAAYGGETTVGAAAEADGADEVQAEIYNADAGDTYSFYDEEPAFEDDGGSFKIAATEIAVTSGTQELAASTTTAAPAAVETEAVMYDDAVLEEYDECADEAPVLDAGSAEPIFDDATFVASVAPDSNGPDADTDAGGGAASQSANTEATEAAPAGGATELTDKKLVADGKICSVVSLTPIDAIVWDGRKYISLHSGKEPAYTRLITEKNLVGDIKRVDGEPKNELETDFFLDAKLYRGDGLTFLTAECTEALLRDELKNPDLPKIKGVDSFTTENVLLIYPVFRDSDYPDHNFIGSDEFDRYLEK